MINVTADFTFDKSIEYAINYLLENSSESVDAKVQLISDCSLESQAYQRTIADSEVVFKASNSAGFMYGLIDLANEIRHKRELDDLPPSIEIKPYIKDRGIKFNIPLDSRTPSYSDASDSAAQNIVNMWDKEFWHTFLDNMAKNKLNLLTLWSLSPFPSLVEIPEYPEIALDDVMRSSRPIKATTEGVNMFAPDMVDSLVIVKKMTIKEKVEFWRDIMQYANDRCIRIMIYTWNLFVFGTEGNPYGITEKQDNPATKDYIFRGTKALFNTYPLLAGIGVTSGENMQRNESDITFIRESYGRAVEEIANEQPDRKIKFIHRMQYTNYKKIVEKFENYPVEFNISFKYSQAHMFSNTRPVFIDSFLEEKATDIPIYLEVRNDDFYMYRWGNPDFARKYLQQMPTDDMEGFNFGPDGYTWGRDYLSRDQDDKEKPSLVMEKQWYMFFIWGQLAYNIDLPNDYFTLEIGATEGFDQMAQWYETWAAASDIIPTVNCTHWHDYDFQWYPEACCMLDQDVDKLVFADIDEFTTCNSVPGGEYLSVSAYCDEYLMGNNTFSATSPIEQIGVIRDLVSKALSGLKTLESDKTQMTRAVAGDIEALCYLGSYYANKIEAAINVTLYRKHKESGITKLEYRNKAVKLLATAVGDWEKYSRLSKQRYKSQALSRLGGYIVDVEHFTQLVKLDVLKISNS